MLSNLVIAAAVPIGALRLSPNCGRNLIRKASEISKFERKDDDSTGPARKRRRGLPAEERLQMRRVKNKESAQMSRDRAKMQRDDLEKQLNELKYQKMKLLMENESLQRQNQGLEEENTDLKDRVQNLHSSESEEDTKVGVAVNHAWFVNVPLLKEWALPKFLDQPDVHPRSCGPAYNAEFKNAGLSFTPALDITCTPEDLSTTLDDIQWLILQDLNAETDLSHGKSISNRNFNRNLSSSSEEDCMESIKQFLDASIPQIQEDCAGKTSEENSDANESMLSHKNREERMSSNLPELPPVWTFDDIFQDIDSDMSFYAQYPIAS